MRILTTHAGSLPKAEVVRDLLVGESRGRDIDPRLFEDAVEAATRDVVERQLKAGIDIIGDGEQGRESFFSYVQHRMSGFGGRSGRKPMADMHDYEGYRERMVAKAHPGPSVNLAAPPRILSEIRYVNPAPLERECERFRRLLEAKGRSPDTAFLTAPSPGIIAAAADDDVYPSMDARLAAIGDALKTEYDAIAAFGFCLQIDAPDLAMERHCLFADESLDAYLSFARGVVETINRALRDVPSNQVRLHVCWGNYEGPHDRDVPLEAIWDVITEANVGGLLLSMANPRHAHEYRLLDRLRWRDGYQLIAGVIDTTTNYVEHPEVVADRLERIARTVPDPSKLVAGTDCGFETAAGFLSVHAPIAWAKLNSLTEGAALASKRLFG